MRFRLFLVLLGALAVVATFTFPIWRPLLVTNQVQETFPGLPPALESQFQALSSEERSAYLNMVATDQGMALAMAQAALDADAVVGEADQAMPTMEAAVIVGIGQFTRIDAVHAAEGTATLYQLPDNRRILRFENFRSTNGPDLRVVLSASEEPLTRAEVELNNLDLDLGALKGNVGNQNYEIPAEVNLSQYRSIVIYCRTFNVVFSSAPIGA